MDFQNACRHDLSGLDNFITAFLSASSVQTIIDELQLPLIVRNTPNYHYHSTYEMEGALTVSLLQGGAYKKFAGSEEKARRLARDFVNVIGHEHTEVFKIVGALDSMVLRCGLGLFIYHFQSSTDEMLDSMHDRHGLALENPRDPSTSLKIGSTISIPFEI